MRENIDRSVWVHYFAEFSRRNQSRATRLELFGELGAQEQELGMRFEGITMSNGGVLPSVEIMLAGRDARQTNNLTRVIPNVCQITPKRDSNGRDEALEIVSDEEGNRSLLRFEPLCQDGRVRALSCSKLE